MEDEVIVLPPYWLIMYIDDQGQKHIATIKDKNYLIFIESRYRILDKKAITV